MKNETQKSDKKAAITGIVLAAGRSRRMGRPKQLLPLGPHTVIEVVSRAIRPHVDQLVIVIGHVADQVAAVLSGLDVVIAVNEDVDRGMLSSVQAGMRMADTNVHGYFICLGDQPEVSACVIERVLESAHGRAGIIIPTTDGKRGHPIFIHRRYAEQILRLDSATTGLNSVTRSNEHDTLEIPVEDSLILLDMDTPADYERVLQHAKGNV